MLPSGGIRSAGSAGAGSLERELTGGLVREEDLPVVDWLTRKGLTNGNSGFRERLDRW